MKLTSKKVKEYMEWRTDEELRHCPDAIADLVFPEKTQSVQVIIDGHRYNVI